MPFKPNYQQQRGDRTRSKDQKKNEKIRRRQEQSDQRKSIADDVPHTESDKNGTDSVDASS